MRLEIDIAEHHYNNIMALDSVSIGRVPYKGIIMYSINAIKHGKVLEQEPTTKNDCEHCSKTYGTLGCCDFVSNEPVYSCKEGHEEYARGIRKLGTTTKNDLGVDCISREAVERIINKWLSHSDYELKDHIYSMTKKIHNLPSVTPQEPKTGHWVHGEYCSECGCDVPAYIIDWKWQKDMNAKYCPNCGAKMESEVEDGSTD